VVFTIPDHLSALTLGKRAEDHDSPRSRQTGDQRGL
jgi:hypothetical protein